MNNREICYGDNDKKNLYDLLKINQSDKLITFWYKDKKYQSDIDIDEYTFEGPFSESELIKNNCYFKTTINVFNKKNFLVLNKDMWYKLTDYILQSKKHCNYIITKNISSIFHISYGNIIVKSPQPVVEEKYDKINGVIQQGTLNKIIFDNIPDNFNKQELKSAIVWGALNRANSINGIEEVLRLKYITQNEKMKMGNPDDDSCQFVKYYVKLSEDNTWVQNTKTTLEL